MIASLKNQSFLNLSDVSPHEINDLLQLALQLKAQKKQGKERQLLKGKNIALIFEKPSTQIILHFVL